MRVPCVALVPRLRIAAATVVAVAASSSLLPAQINRSFEGVYGAGLSRVAVAGDVDHDGIDDIVVGAPYEKSPNGTGAVYVYSGADGTTLLELRADGVNTPYFDFLGWAVCGQTDFDGDGYDDLVLGDPRVRGQHFWGPLNGGVGVYSVHLEVWLTVANGESGIGATPELGYSVAGAGDLNGDGFDEAIAGAPGHGSGAALVLDRTDPLNVGWFDPPPFSPSGLRFGEAVTIGGDWDADGTEDIVIGAPGFDGDPANGVYDNGAIYVYSGATRGLVTSTWPPTGSTRFGASLARVGDVDGDGNSEVAVGAPSFDDAVHGRPDVGYAVILSAYPWYEVATAYGDLDGMHLGTSVTGVGDVNGDGVLDFAAGAPDWNGGIGLAAVYSAADASPLYQYEYSDPSPSGLDYGYGLCLAGGDLDHDGYGDLIVGGENWDSPVLRGLVDVWMGAPALTFSYGTGWPGKLLPTIDTPFPPVPGAKFELHIHSSSTRDLSGFLLIGMEEAKIPFKKGGTLLLLPAVVAPIDIKGSLLVLSDTLPDDAALYGVDYFVQVALFDTDAVGGLAFTAGQHVQIGFAYPE